MTTIFKDFDFSQLTPAERIALAQDLWDSIHDETQLAPLPDDQIAEIKRRIAAIDAGTMPMYPWEEVKQRLLDRK